MAQVVRHSPLSAGVPSSHLGPSMWVLWWTKRDLGGFFSGFLPFSPATNFISPHSSHSFRHGRLARWIKSRACDVGEAKEGLENELWRRWSNGRVRFFYVISSSLNSPGEPPMRRGQQYPCNSQNTRASSYLIPRPALCRKRVEIYLLFKLIVNKFNIVHLSIWLFYPSTC